MKNPLESIPMTIALGFLLTVVLFFAAKGLANAGAPKDAAPTGAISPMTVALVAVAE